MMSRYRLNWYELEDIGSGQYLLKFPVGNIYAELVDQAFPAIQKSRWTDLGSTVFSTTLKSPSAREIKRLQQFLDLLKQILALRLNKNLAPYFKEGDLDQCFAIDFNLEDPNTYTGVGAAEYAAKYQNDQNSAKKLAELLAAVCSLHPNLQNVDYIAAVPGNPGKEYHLPDFLVKEMGKHLARSVGLDLRKTQETPQLKNVSLAEKISTLKGVYELDESVDSSSVLLVDDLYQSGTTMWTLARLLKESGAAKVYGLACVKSWRDTDNK